MTEGMRSQVVYWNEDTAESNYLFPRGISGSASSKK